MNFTDNLPCTELSEISVLAVYPTEHEGEFDTAEFKIFFANPDTHERISPWHDIPLYFTSDILNMVVEVPRGSMAKMEIYADDEHNPIKHDLTDSGDIRYYKHPTPLPGSYGSFPQTLGPDGDPLDVVEISGQALRCGDVVRVKIITVIGLIDQGEEDWKIIVRAIHADPDPLSPPLKTEIEQWFREYKVYEGKAENTIVDVHVDPIAVVYQAHRHWLNTRL
jgi:inorganic pyrophosphatase